MTRNVAKFLPLENFCCENFLKNFLRVLNPFKIMTVSMDNVGKTRDTKINVKLNRKNNYNIIAGSNKAFSLYQHNTKKNSIQFIYKNMIFN